MILIPLISTVWLAAMVMVVSVCRMAANRESVAMPRGERSPRLLDASMTHWEQAFTVRVHDRRANSPVRSQPSTAEHVGNGAQQNLHVGP